MSVGDRSRRQHKDKNYFAKKNTLWSIVDANFGRKLLEINLYKVCTFVTRITVKFFPNNKNYDYVKD